MGLRVTENGANWLVSPVIVEMSADSTASLGVECELEEGHIVCRSLLVAVRR